MFGLGQNLTIESFQLGLLVVLAKSQIWVKIYPTALSPFQKIKLWE